MFPMNDALPIVGTAYYFTKELFENANKFGIYPGSAKSWDDLTPHELHKYEEFMCGNTNFTYIEKLYNDTIGIKPYTDVT